MSEFLPQDSNRELRSKTDAENESNKAETPNIELFDFKTKFAETKAHAKVREMIGFVVVQRSAYWHVLRNVIRPGAKFEHWISVSEVRSIHLHDLTQLLCISL